MPFSVKRCTNRIKEIEIPFGERKFRSFLVEAGAETILVDTGIADTAEEFVNTTRGLNLTKVVITHAHGDHVGGLTALKAALPDLPVACHEKEAQLVWPKDQSRAMPVEPDLLLQDGSEVAPAVRVVHVPGHTPGNIALLVTDDSTLIAGDCVFGAEAGRRAALSLPPREYSLDPEQANKNVSILLDYDFNIALLSHGDHLLTEAHDKIAKLV